MEHKSSLDDSESRLLYSSLTFIRMHRCDRRSAGSIYLMYAQVAIAISSNAMQCNVKHQRCVRLKIQGNEIGMRLRTAGFHQVCRGPKSLKAGARIGGRSNSKSSSNAISREGAALTLFRNRP